MGGENPESKSGNDGIFQRGVIVGRTRKVMEGGCRYMYEIDTGAGFVRASVWGEHDYMPLNAHVEVPIEIRPYVTAKGRPMYQLAIPNGAHSDGEEDF